MTKLLSLLAAGAFALSSTAAFAADAPKPGEAKSAEAKAGDKKPEQAKDASAKGAEAKDAAPKKKKQSC